jgi:hypothetical protein
MDSSTKVAAYRSPEMVTVGDVSSLTQGDKTNYPDYLGNPATEFTGPVDDDGKKKGQVADATDVPESGLA